MSDLTRYTDDLANDIRTVDGNHDLGAGALAEDILNGPTLARIVADAEQRGRAEVTAANRKAISAALRGDQ